MENLEGILPKNYRGLKKEKYFLIKSDVSYYWNPTNYAYRFQKLGFDFCLNLRQRLLAKILALLKLEG